MNKLKRLTYLSGALILAMLFGVWVLQAGSAASAQDNDPARSLEEVSPDITENRATGLARVVRFSNGAPTLSAPRSATAETRALAFFADYGSLFGVSDPSAELSLADVSTDYIGTTRVKYAQTYQGMPVFAGELLVHFDAAGELTAVNGAFVPDIRVSPTPSLSAAEAEAAAFSAVTAERAQGTSLDLHSANTTLLIFREGLAKGVPGPSHLAYQVEVRDAFGTVRDFVFVDAHSGRIIDQYSTIQHALDREVYLEALAPANLVWQEGDPLPYTGDEELGINRVIDYAEDTYDMFFNLSGGTYDSWDGNGAKMLTVYNDPRIACPNANWNGVSTNYCTGVDADDTVAHEWAHAYTQETHNLIYQWQPGALNEAYSDIFGEVVDFINGAGTDSPGGPRTAGACSIFTPVPPKLTVNTPASIAGDYEAGGAQFGPAIDGTVTGDLALANDGSANPTEACGPLQNDMTGQIAFIRRGSCAFTTKVKNAQDAGAIGAIVANHEAGGDNTITMAGEDPSITIQSIFIGHTDGNTIEDEIASGVNATLALDAGPVPPDNSYRWLSGEDDPAFGGAIRDMWSPGCYGDPASVADENYFCSEGDSGGVHTNSGVPNHAFALLVDGGTFSGTTVSGIGLTKASHIYWRAMTVYQNQSTDFTEHADALEMSCNDLRVAGTDLTDLLTGNPSGEVIDQNDCDAVADAMTAVNMRADVSGFCGFEPLLEQSPPPVCDGIGNPQVFFTDTLESNVGWTTSTDVAFDSVEPLMWVLTNTLPDGRAGSGFYAINESGGTCSGENADPEEDSRVMHLDSPEFTVPMSATHARVSFWHYVSTELLWDGGNVKISVNGGDWQLVQGQDYTFNPYNATLQPAAAGNTNPIAGEEGFTGTDGGEVSGTWGQSQVNINRYAKPGDTVQLRFDFGSDGCNGIDGWYLDNVQSYFCDGQVDPDIAVFNGAQEINLSSPADIDVTIAPSETRVITLDIMNTGINDLTWMAEEDNAAHPRSADLSDLNLASLERDGDAAPSSADGPFVTTSHILQDGGFESGTPPWTPFGINPLCTEATCGFNIDRTGEGSGYLWFGGFGVPVTGGITQTVTLSDPAFDQLNFYIAFFGDADAVFTATVDGTAVYTATVASSLPGAYTLQTVDISAYVDGGSHVIGFAAATTGNIFVDDASIESEPCVSLTDIPWLTLSPTSGTVSRDMSDQLTLTIDTAGIAEDDYDGNVCISSNAPDGSGGTKAAVIPIDLLVEFKRLFFPYISKAP